MVWPDLADAGARGAHGRDHATSRTRLTGTVTGVLAGPPTKTGSRVRCGRGGRQRHQRIPYLAAGAHLARAGGAALLRQAARSWTAARGGRLAGRREHRVLPPPRARRGDRRLRNRSRSTRPRAAARRRRARTPLRSRACREPAAASRRSRPAGEKRVHPVLQRLLDQIEAPAIISNVQGDYLTANMLGRALYAPVFESPEQPPNSARFTFLDPAARDFYPDWDRLASSRLRSARTPDATPTIAHCKISSASCRRGVATSASAGRRTTSGSTGRGASVCTTRSSESWSSATRP